MSTRKENIFIGDCVETCVLPHDMTFVSFRILMQPPQHGDVSAMKFDRDAFQYATVERASK